MTLTRRPRVSVHMPAFNHEAYIGEALDSVLAQETRFDYEIVIGEDRSTDGTLAVAKAYASRFPAMIRRSRIDFCEIASLALKGN